MRKSSCNITKITKVIYVKWLNNISGLKAISNGTNTSNIILKNEVKKSQYILNTDSGCIMGILLMMAFKQLKIGLLNFFKSSLTY
jgi:hypothetical protein